MLKKLKKVYWKIQDFNLVHYLNIKYDNLTIFLKLFIKFGYKYFKFSFHSQQNEDKYLLKFFKLEDVKNGKYLEIGAYDGKKFSNSYFLEYDFNFTGILIEPQPDKFDELKVNRIGNKLFNCAVSNLDDKNIEFIGNNLEAGILNNLSTDINKFEGWSAFNVENKKMHEIIEESEIDYLDIMFIDTEGSELEIIESIDFNFPIKLIIVEKHLDEIERDSVLRNTLSSHNFKLLYSIRGNYWFINEAYDRKDGLGFR